ncbi:MAG: MurT ligase domain-containing protein [Lachnospiraceae bacterium]|nr:MurT ligase domain-containing protein [Lachnospiraceae bacterium]
MSKRGARFYLGHFAGKLAYRLQRMLGMNATYMPGEIALRLCPDYLGLIGKPKTLICVTGTNGKTTVCNLLNDILAKEGYTLLNNSAGSNTNSGIATALMKYSGLSGNSRKEIGIIEVDERSSHKIYPKIRPNYIVCTNLFRDSITRNAHAEYIKGIVDRAVNPEALMILNADDPISSRLAESNPRKYFAIDKLPTDKEKPSNIINDLQICPVCGERLKYRYSRYHHIGNVYCPRGDYESPKADYPACVDIPGNTLSMELKGRTEKFELISNSIFNIYNQVTVITVLDILGISADRIREGFKTGGIVESRYSDSKAGKIEVITHLAKGHNPIACSCVFDYAVNEPGEKEILLYPDDELKHMKTSENITWAYDADFEKLAAPEVVKIVVAGRRAEDYRLRLLLAGVDGSKIFTTADEENAYKLLDTDRAVKIFILHQVYKIDMAGRAKEKLLKEAEANG